jgi:hypothetical protein
MPWLQKKPLIAKINMQVILSYIESRKRRRNSWNSIRGAKKIMTRRVSYKWHCVY